MDEGGVASVEILRTVSELVPRDTFDQILS